MVKATKPDEPVLHVLTSDEIEAILDRDDLGEKTVAMPEWGKDVAVQIRGLSMADIWDARRACEGVPAGVDRTAAIDLEFIRLAVTAPKLTKPQIEKLRGKSADAVLRLIREISALNASTMEVSEAAAGEFPAGGAG